MTNNHSGRPTEREYRDVDISEQEWGSDFIADLLKAYNFKFVSFNPGASFRGIEESIINYNNNTPKVIQAPHEGLSVSVAHGYAKATGDPALCILHNVVGTMHGAMSLYNAYVDRVPILALSGTGPMSKRDRRPRTDWIHTALVQGNIIRNYVKWDDQPDRIDGALESITRAHRLADTKPKGPTYVTIDHNLQENALDAPIEIPSLEKLDPPSRMAPDPTMIEEATNILLSANHPVILTDQVGDSRRAVNALVDLAETLGAAVVDSSKRRYNFPNTHPMELTGTEVYREADVILGLDVWSYNDTLKDTDRTRHELEEAIEGDFKLIDISLREQEMSSLFANSYAQRKIDVRIAADTELAVPALRDSIVEQVEDDDALQRQINDRFDAFATRHNQQRAAWTKQVEKTWDEMPIALPRLTAELGDTIADDKWVIVNGTFRGWPHRLWEINDYDQYIGGRSGGAGVGYGIGAAIGGALAYQDTERIPINLQTDGDLMFYPGALWMLGHYSIPMLTVVHNNQTLYNSTEHRINLAEFRGRDDSYERALIGTGYWDPTPDYGAMAESMGVNGYGPIKDPDDIAGALQAALNDVKNGEPALVDVICQPR